MIIDAIIGARKIFQRMKNYAIYSVASTIRIVLLFSVLTIAWNFLYPTILMVILGKQPGGLGRHEQTDRERDRKRRRKIEIFASLLRSGDERRHNHDHLSGPRQSEVRVSLALPCRSISFTRITARQQRTGHLEAAGDLHAFDGPRGVARRVDFGAVRGDARHGLLAGRTRPTTTTTTSSIPTALLSQPQAFNLDDLSDAELRGLIYIQVAVSGQALIFITRARTWPWKPPRPGYAVALVPTPTLTSIRHNATSYTQHSPFAQYSPFHRVRRGADRQHVRWSVRLPRLSGRRDGRARLRLGIRAGGLDMV